MEVDQVAPVTSKKKNDKSGSPSEGTSVKKSESPSDSEDPKPRIVLTFRSEKSGAKNSAMKIVPPEEKQEDCRVIPRRSCKQRQIFDETEYVLEQSLLSSPDKKKKKAIKTEKEEVVDSPPATPKRSTRRRSREFDVVASAIARKEKSYNETPAPTRPSRRIKPTAKILANEEIKLESHKVPGNDKSPEEGVRTRRSVRGRGNVQDESPIKKEMKESAEEDDEEEDNQNQVMKLKHLCELGLKAIKPEDTADESQEGDIKTEPEDLEPIEIDDEGSEDEEIDDDTEVISKLLEADAESIEEDDYSGDSDDEYPLSKEVARSRSTRRSTRLQSGLQTDYKMNDSDTSSPALPEDDDGAPRRRSTRKRGFTYHNYDDIVGSYKPQHSKKNRPAPPQEDQEGDTMSEPAAAEEGSEAACPPDNSSPIAMCTCETISNVYAAQEDLKEPVFCQAIELIDGVRVGCSHGAARAGGAGGGEAAAPLAALVRAGLRAPYFLACPLHLQQLRNHMCCPTCGVFCTQGKFYQCSKGHLFHGECGLPFNEHKAVPGCPHCGMWSYRWKPVNRKCTRVKVQMHSSNKRIFLPQQREQCTQAYQGFSILDPSVLPQEPVIPEDLLPKCTADLKRLCERPDVEVDPVVAAEALCDAILAGESAEEIIPKILSSSVNTPVASLSGGTCLHAAARSGHLTAVYLLHSAGADLNYIAANKTPLIAAVLALLEKEEISPKKAKLNNYKNAEDVELKEQDGVKEDDIDVSEIEKPKEDCSVKDENLMKVIRYLVVAGCDVNLPGPDGMTALHIAAQHGSVAVCRVLLEAGAAPEARDQGGWTPLVWAAEHQHHHAVKLLLRFGADAGSRDAEGNGAVHWCALAGAARALPPLLAAAPAILHHTNAHADTPLHVAARQGHYACVIILLARGAKVDVQNSAGELPMDVCEGKCRSAIALNMQLKIALGEKIKIKKILSSDISHGRELYPIPCVNEVDDTPLPDDFQYVSANVMLKQINIDMTVQTLQGCTCRGECGCSVCACCVLGVCAGWRRGALPPAFPFHNPPMLFECNHTCSCNAKKCTNNVITRLCRQGSVFVPSTVYRTVGRGWGLRADRDVARGAPVAAYVGELLTVAEADTRANDQYLFALDIKQDLLEQCSDKTQLCVDAAQYGGGARFINHSCRPNLVPVRVFTTTRDLRVPTVTLFAVQDIPAGQELTFDYGDKFWSVKSKWLHCECGAIDCRYPAGKSENSET